MLLCFILAVSLATLAVVPGRRQRQERLVFACAAALVELVFLVCLWVEGSFIKVIGTLLMPAGILWVVGLTATAGFIASGKRGTAGIFLGLWLAYSAIGSLHLGIFLNRILEREYAEIDPFDLTWDAVVVLGGGTASLGDYEFLGLSGDRVMLGARLWHTGRTPVLITTGSTPPNARYSHVSADVTARIWEDLGIPEESILRISTATDTTEELQAIADLVQRQQWRHVGLVTSARHMRRAMRNAQRFGVTLHPLPADFATGGSKRDFLSMIPQGRGFHLVHTATWELLGSIGGQ